MLRALIYVRLPSGGFDERGFRMFKAIRETRKSNQRLSLPQFKELLTTQYQLVLMNDERAIEALPKLLARDEGGPAAASAAFSELVGAAGALEPASSKAPRADRRPVRREARAEPESEGSQCLTQQVLRNRPFRTRSMIA